MKNVVTPETARKLKEAGFKQPSYSMCQIWYDPNGMKWIRMMPSYWTNPENGFTVDNANFKLAAFAPTATDILQYLSGDSMAYVEEDKEWFVFVECAETGDLSGRTHENPAEAAALAWLEKHAK